MNQDPTHAPPRPRDRVEAAGWGLAGLAVGLPLVALSTPDATGYTILGLSALVVGASASWPPAGVALLMLLLPVSVVIHTLNGGRSAPGEIVEALVMAFALGASLRAMARRPLAGERLALPALVILMVVVTSTLVEFRIMQEIAPRRPLLAEVWQYAAWDYWIEVREFPVLRHALRWVAAMVTAVYVERILRRSAIALRWLAPVWLAAGAIGALVVTNRLLVLVLEHEDAFWPALWSISRVVRLSVLQPDVNAAGSYFLLFVVPALVLGFRHRSAWLLGACTPILLAAFAIARSRAAVGAGVAVLCATAIMHTRPRRFAHASGVRRGLVVGIAALGAFVLVVTYYATAESHAALGDALTIRLDLAEAGLTAAQRNPVFGVGLSDYVRATRRFVTEDMTLLRAIAPTGENAHNNFLQIMVELGVPGCLLFLWLVGRGLRAGVPRRSAVPGAAGEGMAMGVLAFLASMFFGHPLLIPLTLAGFFLALGMSAGLTAPVNTNEPSTTTAAWGVAGFYLVSLFWRW